jgi:hypothetical protein
MPFRPVESPTLNNLMRFEQITPQATRWESMKASYQQTLPSTLLGGFLDRQSAPGRNEGPMLSAEEANNLFPDIEMPFTRPVSRGFAEHVNLRQAHKRDLQMISAMAPRDTLQFMLDLGASMGASITDPAEFLITMTAAGAVFKGLKSAKILQEVTKRQEFTRALISNAIGSVAVEPLIAMQDRYFQEERTAQEVFASMAASTILGTAIEFGVGRLISPTRLKEDFVKAQTAAELGKRPEVATRNLAPTVQVASEIPTNPNQRRLSWDDSGSTGRRFDNPTNDRGYTLGDFPYEFRPMSGDVRSARFFTVTQQNRGPIRENSTPLMSVLIDGGIQLSDNPRVAASFADSGGVQQGSIGSLREVQVNSERVFNADLPYAQQDRAIRKIMEAIGRVTDDVTLAEALKDVQLKDSTKIQDHVLRIMREQDIDGFYFKDVSEAGESFNSFFLRDGNKLNERGSYELRQKADAQYNDKMQKYKEDLTSDKSDYYYSKETEATYNETSPEFKEDIPEMPEILEVNEAFEGLKSREKLDRATRDTLEDIQVLEAEAEQIDKVIKSAFFCGGQQ